MVIGDCHFGAGFSCGRVDPSSQVNTRLLDYEKTFNSHIDYCVERGIKLVVLTGDIFDSKAPTASQHKIFSACVRRGMDKGIKFIIVVGNHDQTRTNNSNSLNVYKNLKVDGLYVYDEFGVYKTNGINIFLMPYRDRKNFGVFTNAEAVDVIKRKLNAVGFSELDNKVVVGHYMFDGTFSFASGENFSMTEISLPVEMFNSCKATVMGHIHRPKIFSTTPFIAYAGSMERNNYGEKGYDKGIVIIDTDDCKKCEFVPRKVKDLHDIKFDYSDKDLKQGQTAKKLFSDIDKYAENNNIKDAIVRINAKVDEADLYTINQNVLKNYLYNKGINYCSGISITSFMKNNIKGAEINEMVDNKKVMELYLEGLDESEENKKEILAAALEIIGEDEVLNGVIDIGGGW